MSYNGWVPCFHEYGDDTLFIACSIKTGAIYFASKKADKMTEMWKEFCEKHPKLTNDLMAWASYTNQFSYRDIKAMEKGAKTHSDIFSYHHNGTTEFKHYIYTIEGVYTYFNGVKEDTVTQICAYCSELTEAKKKINDFQSPEYQFEMVSIYRVLLDGDEKELISAYIRDGYNRLVKMKGENNGID